MSILFVICSDFLTNENGEPLVEGNWPPAKEVAEECIVKEVAQWWSRQGGEEEVLCERCYVEHLAASRAKRRKMLGGDKVSSREYQNRTELNSGYYTKQSWVSSKFKGYCVNYFVIILTKSHFPHSIPKTQVARGVAHVNYTCAQLIWNMEKKKN
jgi:hypothetical protein